MLRPSPPMPCALAIGGLDPGGGAGLAADLRAFDVAGVFGCAAAALLTVQSTAGLRRTRVLPARDLQAQAEEVLAHQRVRAVKIGALGSTENVRAVARLAARHPDLPLVVDTPMRPSRGRASAALLAHDAVAVLRDALLPRTTVATLNCEEAEALLGQRVTTVSEAHDAARSLARLGPRAVLVKGGHMTGPAAIDVLALDGEVVELRARRLAVPPTHGTGCVLAALIAGRLARGGARAPSRDVLVAAIRWAKRVHHAALGRAIAVGAGLRVLTFRSYNRR